MGKLATLPKRAPTAPVASKKGRKADTRTHEGGAGFSRDAKSELFLLAATNMVSENTFYERGKNRDERFVKLIQKVAHDDPDWLARFVPFLRDRMNMRSASIVMAAETVHSKLTQPVAASTIHNRDIIAAAIKRADEPAEMLGYWMSEYGKNFPMPVKRGVADAVVRLYNERNLIKYDGGDKPIRFGDVIDLVHPTPKADWQGLLFKYALDDRHKRPLDIGQYEMLGMTQRNREVMALPQEAFRDRFNYVFVEEAGLTWEQASSKYGALDAKFWEAMIPSMGVFALVRNLRNFDDSDISKDARKLVVAKLTDAEVIAKSRMFPLRFFSAMVAVKTLHYHEALEEAINLSMPNVPSLPGKTLVLVDVSGSMDYPLADKSDVKRLAPASIFGAAVAIKAEHADLYSFSNSAVHVPFRKGQSVLLATKDIVDSQQHGGTNLWGSVSQTLKGHDRLVIITDEQAHDSYGNTIPDGLRTYLFNMAGYRAGTMPSGKKNRYTFGGLSDAAFTAMELLEKGNDADWPF